MAYTITFSSKADGVDYVVGKLEALWWSDEKKNLAEVPQEKWRWRFAIRTPDHVNRTALKRARTALKERDKATTEIEEVELTTTNEGRCAQILHVGPYEKEQSLEPRGSHHEIYLNDPRRVDPSKLKTIIRQPVGRAPGMQRS